MKKCTRCKEEKELEAFPRHRKYKDGRYGECKECKNSRRRTGKPNLGRFQKGESRGSSFPKGNIPWNKGKIWGSGRNGGLHKEWADDVKERDEYTCVECGTKEGRIHAHHVIPWKENEELRFDIDNGLTLCVSCHAKLEGYQVGHRLTEEALKKLKNSLKGKTPWNKGLKMKKDCA